MMMMMGCFNAIEMVTLVWFLTHFSFSAISFSNYYCQKSGGDLKLIPWTFSLNKGQSILDGKKKRKASQQEQKAQDLTL